MIVACIRFYLLTSVNYHEHVTEWGVHWNFYLTIALIRILMVFLRSTEYAMFYGFSILVINEFIQKEFNLKSYILHAPRTDLISANKEGLISLPGYVAIQLIGIGLGRDIYQTLLFDEPSKLQKELKTKEGMEKRKYSEIKALLKMVTYCILFFIASELSYDAFDTPSRRLCNMSWIMY